MGDGSVEQGSMCDDVWSGFWTIYHWDYKLMINLCKTSSSIVEGLKHLSLQSLTLSEAEKDR